jgi:hypothetical protein
MPNHQIQLVGWDNKYSASNFSTKPPLDGAWIAKNSWGEESGDDGYYYISYADNTLAKSLSAVTRAEAGTGAKLYIHDSFGQVGAINFNSSEAWSASSFDVDGPGEKLSAVSFHTPNANVTYEVWFSPTGSFGDKRLAKTGKVANAGYVTVDFDKPMDINGDDFTVMVRFRSSSVVNLSLQKNVPGYLENATASKGESFASRDGLQWLDVADKMKDASLCVRAWTVTGDMIKASSASSVATIGGLSTQVSLKLGLGGVSALESLGCYAKLPDKSATKTATREEFAYILARALQLPNAPGKSPIDIGESFARSAIIALCNKKITSISADGTFHPTDPILQRDVDEWLEKAVALMKTAKK